MGVGYSLINQTRRECIIFSHVAASTAREIAGNPAAAAIVSWYLLEHPGDAIAFVSDTHGDWPFRGGSRADMHDYDEVTAVVVEQLLEQGILSDHGRSYVDDDDPDHVYVRDLRNAWMPDTPAN